MCCRPVRVGVARRGRGRLQRGSVKPCLCAKCTAGDPCLVVVGAMLATRDRVEDRTSAAVRPPGRTRRSSLSSSAATTQLRSALPAPLRRKPLAVPARARRLSRTAASEWPRHEVSCVGGCRPGDRGRDLVGPPRRAVTAAWSRWCRTARRRPPGFPAARSQRAPSHGEPEREEVSSVEEDTTTLADRNAVSPTSRGSLGVVRQRPGRVRNGTWPPV